VAYTRNNAWAGFQENVLGEIRAGHLADFVVLDEDILAIDPVGIRDVRVLRTVIGGREEYSAP